MQREKQTDKEYKATTPQLHPELASQCYPILSTHDMVSVGYQEGSV